MIRRLLRTLALAARTRRPAHGGMPPPRRPGPDTRLAVLSPGRPITDPDEAEALGMTADARRMRERGSAPSEAEGRFPPGFIDHINQSRRP
ncbi:hypothetical protein [Streptomyces ortus]|uniref:Uncharacterized protein n=1 Tax=Streptomyces ortus TaxID=2867268 RepID=A0ABT3UWN5_9ACTN|nr:hypothetical protein [Streptomyces ortus]MCX4231969.1 hypothetical protein [Streptomyces ortus]